ncbi:MAG: ferritin-like domain-containing protein, partial [Chitinophagaceae bacterium]
MEKLNDLRDLLKHELQDLYSVEEQIIAALPRMIEKASNKELKNALTEHLRITEQQKARLESLQQQMDAGQSQEAPGLLGRLFKSRMVCEGMQGIIKESNKILNENMNPDVMDAAIIACAQKVEHYEICGYGTAKAYAEELNLTEVARVLDQTLNEEYDADDRLTVLATTRLNRQAESGNKGGAAKGRGAGSSATGGSRSGAAVRQEQPEMELEMASASRGSAGRGRGLRCRA